MFLIVEVVKFRETGKMDQRNCVDGEVALGWRTNADPAAKFRECRLVDSLGASNSCPLIFDRETLLV